MLRNFALTIFVLAFVLAASAQRSQQGGPSLAEKVEDLLHVADVHKQLLESLDHRVRNLEQE